jgi:phenylpropionate dioxygenase-like ring-hydroxylating dioxygenase large terminal subunit
VYPFKPGHVFVRNCWYVAALSSELGLGLLERRILNEVVILYRREAGTPAAIAGLCPHRRMPLLMGRRVGDDVQCGYHGMSFGPDGACVRIPSQPGSVGKMRTRAYPVVEKWNWVWIWMGDPVLADPGRIPDHEAMGLCEGWDATPLKLYPVPARYQLLVENLQDLSHISYLHGAYIEDAAWTETPVRIASATDGIFSSRVSTDVPLSGFNTWCFPDAASHVDQELRSVFRSPGLTYSGPTVRESAANGAEGRYLGTMLAVHAITPETPFSTHYFSATTRDFRIGDGEFSKQLYKLDIEVRMQDVVALGAIERYLRDESSIPPEISVKADMPAIQVRRTVEKLIAAERTEMHPEQQTS